MRSKFWIAAGLAVVAGAIAGLGIYTFIYAKGYSYFLNDPKACNNCHVMQEVYDRWNHSSHKSVARCNDCHAPHNLIGKYATKGINGFNHSVAITTGEFKEPIMIKKFNRDIVQHNCLYCHGDMTASISHEHEKDKTDCLKCHAGVGHGF